MDEGWKDGSKDGWKHGWYVASRLAPRCRVVLPALRYPQNERGGTWGRESPEIPSQYMLSQISHTTPRTTISAEMGSNKLCTSLDGLMLFKAAKHNS